MSETIVVKQVETEVIEVRTPGVQGPTGEGVPAGGTTNQVLRKASDDDFDTEWATGGGGGGTPDAHASSHQNNGSDEINVGGLSGELADPQPPKAHNHDGGDITTGTVADDRIASSIARDTEVSSAVSTHASVTTSVHGITNTANLVLTNDSRLSDARTPTAHNTSHENNGADEISVQGLSGELADPQPPKSHSHTVSDINSTGQGAGKVIKSDGTGGASWQDDATGGGGGTPGGMDGAVQFNDDGSFGGFGSYDSDEDEVTLPPATVGPDDDYPVELGKDGANLSWQHPEAEIKARLNQRANNEVVWSANVDDADDIDDSSMSAFKFAIYPPNDEVTFQTSPDGETTWDGGTSARIKLDDGSWEFEKDVLIKAGLAIEGLAAPENETYVLTIDEDGIVSSDEAPEGGGGDPGYARHFMLMGG